VNDTGQVTRGAPPLPAAVSGALRGRSHSGTGHIAWYVGEPPGSVPPAADDSTRDVPILLVHSVNAAASAKEMAPLYERLRLSRPVYAIDLPGFGHSERSARTYTPRLMTDAIHAMRDEIRREHPGRPVDLVALSLSCEFAARAASERPDDWRSLALVSPTGFESRSQRYGPPGSTLDKPWVRSVFGNPLWGAKLFRLLTTRPSVRFFLRKTFGSRDIDPGLIEYALLSARQPGAEHAPFHFLSFILFSADISSVYESLRLPVWMVHGVRGDFVDYRRKDTVAERPNWTIDVMQSGAMPQYEFPEDFLQRYRAFLASRVSPGGAG
jgi:pimeloyl-ACP methyl ester carboxylesterase